jgi:hypothetical protein
MPVEAITSASRIETSISAGQGKIPLQAYVWLKSKLSAAYTGPHETGYYSSGVRRHVSEIILELHTMPCDAHAKFKTINSM